MTTVSTNVPLLIQRAGYVRDAKQYISDQGCFFYVDNGKLFFEGEHHDVDITTWNMQSLRMFFTGVLRPGDPISRL